MSVETNKALLRRFVEELVNQGHLAVAAELVAPDFIELDPFPGQAPGRVGLIESIERLRTAFPDLVWRIEEMVAEGEKVASLHTWSGTHRGEFLGMAPTGKQVRMSCMIFDTYEEGKLQSLETIRQMCTRWPRIAVVILTTYNEDNLMLRGLQAGASGYLLKDTNRETLFQAIRCAARGETLLQPDILARLLAHTAAPPSSSSSPRPPDIARSTGLTTHTVAAHLTSIYNKLGVDSRASAVAVATQRGLLPPQE